MLRADILELFIKINARVLRRMYLVDHHSNDGSKAIVEAMAAAAYPVRYVLWQGLAFEQAAAITSICHQMAKLDRFDHVLPLDADEFLDESQSAAWAGERRHGVARIGTGQCFACAVRRHGFAGEAAAGLPPVAFGVDLPALVIRPKMR